MKVLLIWEEVPEKTSAYLLEGEDASIALDAHGKYINSDDDEAINALNDLLVDYTPIDSEKPISVEGVDKVVIAGFIM